MAHLPLGIVFNEEDFSGTFAGRLLLHLFLTRYDVVTFALVASCKMACLWSLR